MTTVAELLPGGIPLAELAAGERDGLTIEARCGAAVLLLSTVGMTKARILEKTRTHDVVPVEGTPSGFYAVPLRKSDGSPGAVIRVGRAASNDIVINDVTLSKLHAFVRVSPDGRFTIEDGGSKNGTFVGETPVAPRGSGPAVPLPPKASIRFGSIHLQFMSVVDLRQLMQRLRLG